MRLRVASGIAAAALLSAPLTAAAEQSGRYAMSRVSGGILRLDTATGAVSVCRHDDEEWACKQVSDPQLDLQHEVEKLRGENAALRAELERGGTGGAGTIPPESPDKKQDRLVPDGDTPLPGGDTLLPGNETIDEMVAALEKMMRRFRDMIKSLEENKDERQL